MDYKLIGYTLLLVFVAQILVWYQMHLQFMNAWFKNNEWVMGIVAIPITYLFLYGTKYGYAGFGDLIWPTRFLQFSVGIIIFAFLAYYHLDEGITLKTGVCLALAIMIVGIQLLWK